MYLKQGTGRKVYRNGSFAPTRGTVNPKGYIKREVKRRNRMQMIRRAARKRIG